VPDEDLWHRTGRQRLGLPGAHCMSGRIPERPYFTASAGRFSPRLSLAAWAFARPYSDRRNLKSVRRAIPTPISGRGPLEATHFGTRYVRWVKVRSLTKRITLKTTGSPRHRLKHKRAKSTFPSFRRCQLPPKYRPVANFARMARRKHLISKRSLQIPQNIRL